MFTIVFVCPYINVLYIYIYYIYVCNVCGKYIYKGLVTRGQLQLTGFHNGVTCSWYLKLFSFNLLRLDYLDLLKIYNNFGKADLSIHRYIDILSLYPSLDSGLLYFYVLL